MHPDPRSREFFERFFGRDFVGCDVNLRGSGCGASQILQMAAAAKPVPPLLTCPSPCSALDGPAMSTCTQGLPPTNSCRNIPAVSAPPQRSPVFLKSATSDLTCSSEARRQRQPPHLFAGALAGASTRRPGFVVAHHAGGVRPSATMHAPVNVAKSSIASGLNRRPKLSASAERQPAFGVGVVDLDRLAASERLRRPACTRSPMACSPCTPRARASRRPASLRLRRDGRQHGGRAGHVRLHVEHAFVGLERQPARIERDPLADDDDAPSRARRCPAR